MKSIPLTNRFELILGDMPNEGVFRLFNRQENGITYWSVCSEGLEEYNELMVQYRHLSSDKLNAWITSNYEFR